MATIARLGVEFFGDHAKYDRSVRRVEQGNSRLRGQFGGLARTAAGLFLTGGLAIGAKRLFDIGAAAEETASKFRTVFGPATQDVQAFIDDFASIAGLSQTAARDVVATTGAIAQGMGMAQVASGEFATEVVRLAADLSSFNDIPIAETARSVQSALTGEYESLKRLGIAILDQDVKMKALVMTGKESANQLTHLEKVQARLTLVTERAGVAVGDAVRTQDSAARTAARVEARYENLKEAIAVGLQPAFAGLLDSIDDVTGGLDNASTAGLTFQTWTLTAIGSLQGVGVSAAVAAAGLKVLWEASMVPEAAKGGKGLLGALVHPLETLKGAAENAIHPVQTVKGLFSGGSELVTGKLTAIDNAVEGFYRILDSSIAMRLEIRQNTLQAIEDLKTALEGVDDTDGLADAGVSAARLAELVKEAQGQAAALNESFRALGQVATENAVLAGTEPLQLTEKLKLSAEAAAYLKDLIDEGATSLSLMENTAISFANNAAASIAGFADSGIASFKRFRDYVIRSLIEIAAKFAIFKVLGAIPGFGNIATAFGTMSGFIEPKASGGPVSAGSLYRVNERGMEFFQPSTSGRVIPLGAGGGGPTIVNVHLYADDALRFTESLTAQQRQNKNLDDTFRVQMPVGVLAGAG